MNINKLKTEEILALLDNRFDILINDAVRQGGTNPGFEASVDFVEDTDARLAAKTTAAREIIPLLAEYDARLKAEVSARKKIKLGTRRFADKGTLSLDVKITKARQAGFGRRIAP